MKTGEIKEVESDEEVHEKSQLTGRASEEVPRKSHGGAVLHYIEVICWPFIKFLDLILPINKLPELAFLLCLVIFFVSVDFILTVVSVFSIYTHLSHIFLALTFISWGSSPIELINLTLAVSRGELHLGLTSILSGIVLAFYVLLPSAIIFKLTRRQSHEIQLLQPIHSSHLLFLPALALSFLTLMVYQVSKMRFSKLHSGVLVGGYVAYVGYMWS